MLLISIIVAVGTYVLSPVVFKILSGEGFSDAVLSLKILSFSLPAFFVSALLMWVFVLLKKYKQVFYIYSFGLIINIFLNLIFIPKYSYMAAAYITGVSEYLILFLQILILYFEFKDDTKD